jgi:hypothetical protein
VKTFSGCLRPSKAKIILQKFVLVTKNIKVFLSSIDFRFSYLDSASGASFINRSSPYVNGEIQP